VPIAEFPQFTFLYADLHAHMMALPLALLAIAFALAYAGGARKWWALGLGAIAVGMLWPTNTWDYPPYLLLALCGLALGAISLRQQARPDASLTWRDALSDVISALPAIIAFVALSRAAMIPYLANYGSAYNSIERWTNERTPLNTFITIYGLFLIPLAFALLWGVFAGPRDERRLARISLAVGVAAGAALAVLGVPIAILAAPMAALSIGAAFTTRASTGERLMWLMTAGAWVITLFVELFVLAGDIGRMNTVFKFYIQAWLMLGVASAVALVWSAELLTQDAPRAAEREAEGTAPPERTEPSTLGIILRAVFATAFAVALLLAALYPAFAVPAKIEDRYVKTAPRGLDGMAYMRTAAHQGFCANEVNTFPLVHDYDAIRWMQDNVQGSPTIMEGTTGGQLYCWGNRYSIYTGLPAVIGWQWHQRQQRAALDDRVVYDRDADVTAFYTTPDLEQARMLMRRYRPGYVVAGPLERAQYGVAGLTKFDAMVEAGDLRVAYQNPGVTIYEVVR
jgi:YYY domain-containing protein